MQPDSPLYLVEQPMPWLGGEDRPRRAAVSAFGFGGTNFHLVLEEYNAGTRSCANREAGQTWPSELLLWHGGSREELTPGSSHSQQELEKEKRMRLARYCAASWPETYRPGAQTIAIIATDTEDLTNKIKSAIELFDRKDRRPFRPESTTAKETAGCKNGGAFPGPGIAIPGNVP